MPRSKFDLKRQYTSNGFKKKATATEQPRTQKARGLFELTRLVPYYDLFQDYKKPTNAILLPHELPAGLDFPMFARPCPVTPKHGFVESRQVNNLPEVLTILMETAAADPNGEVILMPIYTGRNSAVATDAGVTWGRGNDGVTAGKGEQFFIPTGNSNAFTVRLKDSYPGAGIKEAAYVELVEHNGNTAVVQLRDGPRLEGASGDWIPAAGVTVTRVIKGDPDIDLVREWPDKLFAARWNTDGDENTGSVIWLPNMSLSSHLAVQALVMGLPVMTTREPIIGETLMPAADQIPPLTFLDLSDIANYIGSYDRFLANPSRPPHPDKWRIMRDDVKTAVGTLHAMSFWDNKPHLLRLRAFAVLTMARYLAAGVIGEARHFNNNGPGLRGEKSSIDWNTLMGRDSYVTSETDRNLVFERALIMPLEELIAPVEGAIKDFSLSWKVKEWEDDRRGNLVRVRKGQGIGGVKWRDSAEIARNLIVAILAFRKEATVDNWNRVITAFNMGVNAAHNNGRVLDKFIDGTSINTAVDTPQFAFINQTAAEVVLGEMTEARRGLLGETFRLWGAEWPGAEWRTISLGSNYVSPSDFASYYPPRFIRLLAKHKIAIPPDATIPAHFQSHASVMGYSMVPGEVPRALPEVREDNMPPVRKKDAVWQDVDVITFDDTAEDYTRTEGKARSELI